MPNFIEELMGQRQLYHVPESPDYTNLDQRLQELEKRTIISDVHLDNLTKPASKGEDTDIIGFGSPEIVGRPRAEVQREELEQQPQGQTQGITQGQTQGISAMQELDMSMIPPEVLVALGDGIKNAVMQDPTVDQATKGHIDSLSDNNIGELVGQILEKGMEIPDEEDSSMSMEKEEEAEGIIDRLMGNETEEMGWRERLNQLGDPEDINFAPTGLNWGGPVQNVPFDPNLGQPPRGTPMPPDLYGTGTPMPPMPPQQTPRQAQMQAALRAAAPRGGGRGWNQGGPVVGTTLRPDPNATPGSPYFDPTLLWANDTYELLFGSGGPRASIPQQTPRQAQMQASLRAAAPRGGGRGWNQGGQVQQYNLGSIASMGRGGDSQLAHVMPGERMVPPGVVDDGMLDAAFVRAGLDPMEYKVGSSQAAVNPMTGMPEYGLFSFVKRLLKKVKKIAPVIGSMVGFAYGGPMGAGIGKAIGGVLKTGDLDFKDALMNFGTGWAMGNFATGMGMKGGVAKGQGLPGMKTIFQGADKGGIWGWGAQTPMGQHTIESGDTVAGIAEKYGITEQDLRSANPGAITPSIAAAAPSIAGAADPYGYGAAAAKLLGTDVQALAGPGGLPGVGTILNVPKVEGVGDFIQSAGARLAGGMGAPGTLPSTGLVEQFKNLPMGQKLGVGALGLAALSKTGMFDEEELGDVPPEIQTEMEGLQAYANQGLKPAIQGQWGAGAPTVSTPVIPSHTSFYTPPSQSSSLTEALAELNKTNLRLPSPVFT